MGQITEDMTFTGNCRFTNQPTFPDGGVTNAKVASNAAIDADKLEHLHVRTFAQPNTAATAETRVVHEVVGATGTIRTFSAGSIAKAVGDSTVTVDLKVNGTTVLSGVITLDNANTNYVSEPGTISDDDLAAGDVLTVVTTATAGTGTLPTGVFAHVTLSEDPA
jgi:hypothetical protein